MEIKRILNSERRKYGQSCMNCMSLELEYDLDETGTEKYVCSRFHSYGNQKAFPFKEKMACFEPCFWYTSFAPAWNASESALEGAMHEFSSYIKSIHETHTHPHSS